MKKGFEHSLDSIRKVRRSMVTKNNYIWMLRNGGVEFTDNLSLWAKQHGLAKSNLCEVASGKRKAYKGWTIIKKIYPDQLDDNGTKVIRKLIITYAKDPEVLTKFDSLIINRPLDIKSVYQNHIIVQKEETDQFDKAHNEEHKWDGIAMQDDTNYDG